MEDNLLKRMNTTMKRTFSQAYKQAPWRKRIQRAGSIALVIISVIFVGMIYLNISAQAASAGMQIQYMQLRKQALARSIASLRTEYAHVSAAQQMKARADALNYKPLSMDKAVYVGVPGYTGRQQVNLAPPPGADMIPQQVMKPSYTQSLWEVFFQQVVSQPASGGK
jgi:hypothetical protein